MGVKVKICGITNYEDAYAASSYGADAIGFVFAKSPRQVTPEAAKSIIMELPPYLVTVGVFVKEEAIAEIMSSNDSLSDLVLDIINNAKKDKKHSIADED